MRVHTLSDSVLTPVSVAEIKSHLRVDHHDEDELLQAYIQAATADLESWLGRVLVNRTLRLTLDRWPLASDVALAASLQQVLEVAWTDAAGAVHVLSADTYIVDRHAEPGRLALAPGASWPQAQLALEEPIRIDYVAGFGERPQDVPGSIRLAIQHQVGHYYEHREPVLTGTIATSLEDLTATSKALARPWRTWGCLA